ncbi:RNA polymerase sigma factor for flagellar operon FliA [Natranaerovirga hydrolytica]|uniref:RNA polymerase sigma factor n=1 Tax=Natranaerovirga hydrolytica TaxID=680378 RepID=A0A4R1N4P5_9FIRM|nr:FliA/WhiG family RNA polymerase sigma factor [Natranaerovirga hydrolytica]TCK97919.1 RNA polymerase sigma factor for flagellar operon FliA [Natranaerovirga hydrolytica]
MEEKNKLWESYAHNKTKEKKDELIIQYAPLVKFVAGRLNMYLGNNVDFEDLVSYGVFGLIDAIDKYDYLKGVKFETYASLRIRGAILDEIRKNDWVPRSLRQKQKKIDTTFQELENMLGREPSDKEMAKALDLSVEMYQEWLSNTKMLSIMSLDEYVEQGNEVEGNSGRSKHFDQPEEVVQKEELKKILLKTIERLTEKEKKVVILYYYEELTLKEISYILDVSESRVSQLHTKALQKMRLNLGSNSDIIMI